MRLLVGTDLRWPAPQTARAPTNLLAGFRIGPNGMPNVQQQTDAAGIDSQSWK